MGVTEFLPVTVDRTHLIVIGEKLYSRSLELVRELVNNGYDADATEVRADFRPDEIVVADDGSGMDRDGLLRYFQVGVPDKREHPHGRHGSGSSASASSRRSPRASGSRS